MRLINTVSGRLEEFVGQKIPKYAILSHTWEEGKEVSYESYQELLKGPMGNHLGYEKVLTASTIARGDLISYIWVDTCCIDRSSSAELSEAINSMYRWYERAEVCFVFLRDLYKDDTLDMLHACRWFRRGWTLQELIAPRECVFFDRAYEPRGLKSDPEMQSLLSTITGIPKHILMYRKLSSACAAEKMSWAASRETTRIEDMAYCLLGLFGLNMPLLYGEEEKAFRRLQEEVLKVTGDLSIFAWTQNLSDTATESTTFSGLLAQSTADFQNCGGIYRYLDTATPEISLSTVGIKSNARILLYAVRYPRQGRLWSYILPLGCLSSARAPLAVRLRKCGAGLYLRENRFSILEYAEISSIPSPEARDYYLLINEPLSYSSNGSTNAWKFSIAETRRYVLQIILPPEIRIEATWPSECFDYQDQLFFIRYDEDSDIATMMLTVTVPVTVDEKTVELRFDCMFFALGWGQPEPASLQCSIVLYQDCAQRINETRSRMVTSNRSVASLLEILDDEAIPKSSFCVCESLLSNQMTVTSFTSASVEDTFICSQRPLTRIEFKIWQCDEEDRPKPEKSNSNRWQRHHISSLDPSRAVTRIQRVGHGF